MRANTVTNWVATVVIAVVSCATLGARVQDQPPASKGRASAGQRSTRKREQDR